MSNLSDIFNDDLLDEYDAIEPAPEQGPLPKGHYIAQLDRFQPNIKLVKRTAHFALYFKITEGPYAGRVLVHKAWYTKAALIHTKRELSKIGLKSRDDIVNGRFDAEAMFKLLVSQRVNDDGEIYNIIIRFERYDEPQPSEANSVNTDNSDDESSIPEERASYPDGKLFDEHFGPGGYRHEND